MYVLVKQTIKPDGVRCDACPHWMKKQDHKNSWYFCELFYDKIGLDVTGQLLRCDSCLQGERNMELLEKTKVFLEHV